MRYLAYFIYNKLKNHNFGNSKFDGKKKWTVIILKNNFTVYFGGFFNIIPSFSFINYGPNSWCYHISLNEKE